MLLAAQALSLSVASAGSSLDRHSPDFQARLSGYGDVWTQQELSVFEEVLASIRRYGLAHTLRALSGRLDALNRLAEKLRYVDDRLSSMVKGILGLSKDVPEELMSRVVGAASGDKNVSKLIAVVNDLYARGELSGADYLLLLGYVANEFKTEYVEDAETLTNIERAAGEVSLAFSKSTVPPLPEPARSGGPIGRSLLARAPESPGLAFAAALSTALAPLLAQTLYAIATRQRHPDFARKVLRTSETIVSSLAFPEDTISAYWAAVNILSRAVPVLPWETHREYAARLSRELGDQRIVSAFRTLAEEYERVRFAGKEGALSLRQLADLVLYIEKSIP